MIRMLSEDKKRGIINIVCEMNQVNKGSKFFEFDIDKLSTKKLRDLEKYVKKCLKQNVSTPVSSKQPIIGKSFSQ